jgi:large subunit ribosomal protein L3
MGNERVTVQNLKVVAVREPDNVLLIEGAVPGHADNYLIIRKAVKKEPKPKGAKPTQKATQVKPAAKKKK